MGEQRRLNYLSIISTDSEEKEDSAYDMTDRTTANETASIATSCTRTTVTIHVVPRPLVKSINSTSLQSFGIQPTKVLVGWHRSHDNGNDAYSGVLAGENGFIIGIREPSQTQNI